MGVGRWKVKVEEEEDEEEVAVKGCVEKGW